MGFNNSGIVAKISARRRHMLFSAKFNSFTEDSLISLSHPHTEYSRHVSKRNAGKVISMFKATILSSQVNFVTVINNDLTLLTKFF